MIKIKEVFNALGNQSDNGTLHFGLNIRITTFDEFFLAASGQKQTVGRDLDYVQYSRKLKRLFGQSEERSGQL